MYIHGFEGSWLKHPFWRTRFLLERREDLELLRASAVPAVLIDVSKGLGSDSLVADEAALPVKPVVDDVEALRMDRDQARQAIGNAFGVAREIYGNARDGLPIDAGSAEPVVAEIAQCVAKNPAMFMDMVRLKSKDEYTYLHSVAVCGLMVNLAREIGLDEAAVRAMGLAGLLHDVGKMAVAPEVLNKPGRLTEAEFAQIKQHPVEGHAMLRTGEGISQEALDVCLYHHEKMDGTGYPFGLQGDRINLAARMGAICDVYDALTSDRVYKERWTPVKAVTEMGSWAGHFDQRLLFAFCHSLGIGPTGRLIRLRSGRLGVVLPDGPQGTRSKIRAFYSTLTHRPIPLEDVFRGVGDLAIGEENPADWGFNAWEAAVARLMEGHMVAPDPAAPQQPRPATPLH